jgi:AcrR family transcriptional regulator
MRWPRLRYRFDVDRRPAQMRLDELMRTACDVIIERGLANTRAADVAAAAGVSQALVFYHFESKERLLARAFAYAAEQDVARLDALVRSTAEPIDKLKSILKLYAPSTGSKAWELWIDGWAEALRTPELEKVTRRLDLHWTQAIAKVINECVDAKAVECPDPVGAAWRIAALIDGLSVQLTVHPRSISRRQLSEWVRVAAARELGLTPEELA